MNASTCTSLLPCSDDCRCIGCDETRHDWPGMLLVKGLCRECRLDATSEEDALQMAEVA